MSLVRRGLEDGSFDAAFDGEWIRSVFWALLYTGWESVERRAHGAAERDHVRGPHPGQRRGLFPADV